MKVNPLDSEATGYASLIFNALKQTSWDVTFSTANADPNTLNNGLFTCVVGSNAGPPDSKDNPEQIIRAAFRAANIEVNGGASIGAGEYKLFILVGHRPLAIGRRKPMLAKLGYWIISVGQRSVVVMSRFRACRYPEKLKPDLCKDVYKRQREKSPR